jgi:hypothetical protein
MRKYVALFAVVAVLLWGGSALAGERIELNCIDMPWCCTFTCVMIDVDCCGYGCPTGPLMAEFLNGTGEVLGTATFTGNWCDDESFGQTDKPVEAAQVCSIRLVKPDDDCIPVTWASLKVYCGDNCCGKWYKVFKGDLWCWQPIPAPIPEPVPVPAVVEKTTPAPKPEPQTEAQPEPQFEMPAEQPAPEPEVIVVPGRG